MRRYDRAHTFFYADPPYWQTEGYGVPFEWEQYEQLAEVMQQFTAGQLDVVVSGKVWRLDKNGKVQDATVQSLKYDVGATAGNMVIKEASLLCVGRKALC